jgi:hypothetical protein
MNAPVAFPINGDELPNQIEPSPIEIDPRPCGLCGRTIDQHDMVDKGEGPEFFCVDPQPDDLTLDELERRAELVRQIEVAAIVRRWELNDPRDRWRHTGDAPPKNTSGEEEYFPRKQPYRTPQSTIDAFWYVAGLDDSNYLTAWLAQHPRDVEILQKLWEAKHARA